ncbi:MAG: orotidine-5'-phosphate decarboxylase [Chloracidobacterium sp.]|nr:orotidine-5'-phosphate decarboxylase [Chloracidobacterium sp.]
MTKPFASEYPSLSPKERIIVALDVPTAEEAREIVRELRGEVGAFKIGSQVFTAAGSSFVKELTDSGLKIFLDLKFHDIPNTVANAAIEAARLGVWMLNVHTLGGSEMMKRTVDEVRLVCEKEGLVRPLIIGVTILTSSTQSVLDEIGITCGVQEQVVKLAKLAADCGLDGVVASPQEIAAVREAMTKPDFLIVTPGIRQFATKDDQKRVKTFTEAIKDGADFAVIGRPIIQANDRLEAVRRIIGETITTH